VVYTGPAMDMHAHFFVLVMHWLTPNTMPVPRLRAKCAWPLQSLSSSFKQGKCWEFVVLCVNALLSVRWFVLTCQVGTIDLEVFIVKIYWFA